MNVNVTFSVKEGHDVQLLIALYTALCETISGNDYSLDLLPSALHYISDRISDSDADYGNLKWNDKDWEFMKKFAGIEKSAQQAVSTDGQAEQPMQGTHLPETH